MRRIPGLVLTVGLVLALFPSTATGALLDAYDVVGTDPSGDAVLPFATGVNWPSCGTGFGCDKYDARILEMGTDEESLHVKLNVGGAYWGTGGILYAVHFTAAGKKLFTCWTIQSAGTSGATTNADIAENTLGCSRFTGETGVGPVTRANGVDVSTASGKLWVRWEVPKSTIEGATELTDIYAEIWARGVSTCCAANAGSSQSQQLWNIADRGPNTGAWTYSLVKAPEFTLDLAAAATEATTGPGGAADYDLTVSLVGTATTNITFTALGLPEGLKAVFDPETVPLAGENATQDVRLSVSVPAGTENQTVAFQVNATSDLNVSAALNLTLVVDASVPPPGAPPGPGNATTNGTATTAAGAPKDEGGGIPAPSVVVAGAVLAGIVAGKRLRGRRRS